MNRLLQPLSGSVPSSSSRGSQHVRMKTLHQRLQLVLCRSISSGNSHHNSHNSHSLPVSATTTSQQLLDHHLPVMIFGSSTDVGKTIISAGLCLAALRSQRKVCYIKPIQTGELDEYFIQFYTNPKGINDIFVRTIQHWRAEMAPPLAIQYDPLNETQAMSDDELIYSVQSEIKAFVDSESEITGATGGSESSAGSGHSSGSANTHNTPGSTSPNEGKTVTKKKKDLFTVVETVGGVLSPGPHNTSQADMYRALRLPVLLVGDSRYGGISSTLCAYESLRMRGYNVLSVALIDRAEPGAPDNAMLIQNHINQTVNVRTSVKDQQDAVKVFTLSPMPMSQKTLLHSWFHQNELAFNEIFDHLQQCVRNEYEEFQSLVEDGRKLLWNQGHHHGESSEREGLVDLVESAHGDHLKVFTAMGGHDDDHLYNKGATGSKGGISGGVGKDKKACRDLVNVYDGTGSCHSQSVGFGNPHMALVIAEACGRFGNSLPFNAHGMLHPPLVQLSEYLVLDGPGKGWAQRVLFADGQEDSLKKALTVAIGLSEIRLAEKQITTSQTEPSEGNKKGPVRMLLSSNPNLSFSGHKTVVPPMPYIAFAKGRLVLQAQELLLHKHQEEVCEDGRQLLMGTSFTSMEQALNLDRRLSSTATAPPSLYPKPGAVAASTPTSILTLATVYESFVNQYLDGLLVNTEEDHVIDALCLEPVLLTHGARSMALCDPLYHKILVKACRERGIPVVYDERTVGLYRLGRASAGQLIQETPDVSCYGRMLSGGYMPLSPVLASQEAFVANQKRESSIVSSTSAHHKKSTLSLNSDSFAASPIACSAALEAIRLIERSPSFVKRTVEHDGLDDSYVEECFNEEEVRNISKLPGVAAVTSIGGVLAVKLSASPSTTQSSTTSGTSSSSIVLSLMRKDRVYAESVGENHRTIYLFANPLSADYDKERLLRVVRRSVTKAHYLRPVASPSTKPATAPLNNAA